MSSIMTYNDLLYIFSGFQAVLGNQKQPFSRGTGFQPVAFHRPEAGATSGPSEGRCRLAGCGTRKL